MDQHEKNVSEVASQVRQFYDNQQPYRIYHGSTNCTRESSKTRRNTIDISSLNHVLHIDSGKQAVLVEPNVAMDQLVEATLPKGLIPPVVMEFPGITTGGGFAGTSGESSSFRHGFFDRTVNWIEVVLANGEIMQASTTDNVDLFYGAAASFGSLGITTLLEVQLIPAKPYARLEYCPISSVSHAVSEIQRYTADPDCHYLDGIMYSRDKGVICAGYLSDKPDSASVQRFTQPTDPWFYMHVEGTLSQGKPAQEYIPIVDYIFRYDRGGFWVGKYACEYFLLPNTKPVRWVLDDLFHTRAMYHAVHQAGLFRRYTIQDIAIPYGGASDLINHLDFLWQISPLVVSGSTDHSPSRWLQNPRPDGPAPSSRCPHKRPRNAPQHWRLGARTRRRQRVHRVQSPSRTKGARPRRPEMAIRPDLLHGRGILVRL